MEPFPETHSLYRLFGVLASDGVPGPGTIETKQIETIDNDQAMVAMTVGMNVPPPGTAHTLSTETMDNDVAPLNIVSSSAGPVQPGTRMTATIETMDADAVAELGTLM